MLCLYGQWDTRRAERANCIEQISAKPHMSKKRQCPHAIKKPKEYVVGALGDEHFEADMSYLASFVARQLYSLKAASARIALSGVG